MRAVQPVETVGERAKAKGEAMSWSNREIAQVVFFTFQAMSYTKGKYQPMTEDLQQLVVEVIENSISYETYPSTEDTVEQTRVCKAIVGALREQN